MAKASPFCRYRASELRRCLSDQSRGISQNWGAANFRSPEAMLNLRWGSSTNIWSFGTTFLLSPQLISLIWGLLRMQISQRCLATFGPLPASYETLIAEDDEPRRSALGNAVQFIDENDRLRPFVLAKDKCFTEEDKEFILKTMKFDPRDRPTAGELLANKWFAGVP
ncbi:hypothetical protein LHYA1_G005495 [Lachnellula hyalina]|uniref:Protein kinase domain-containing protein n=1 Tax=Lachnellula hyalina TaxID=1316788 RepID=A0A8H8R1H9_9HELO|nr:uncharacterized protein LHYA1_G005495 [Lachnellula hyalina]TVY26045.1 hypothetical protein LHYA1_G005495 [Lachnellula hyalina]